MQTTQAPTLAAAPIGALPATAKQRLLRALTPLNDRRDQQRRPAPFLFRLTPLEDLGRGRPGPPIGASQTVVGKDICHDGLCFFHEQPLTYRFVRIAIDDPQIGRFELEVQLTRCRFTKLGWYESAGRLIAVRG